MKIVENLSFRKNFRIGFQRDDNFEMIAVFVLRFVVGLLKQNSVSHKLLFSVIFPTHTILSISSSRAPSEKLQDGKNCGTV
jgi:hypothetical protein